ncbi:MAG: 50S ribosomal protein L10 [candidate division Zixibacteria bacterium]|nr:50S ribosomal protein L10 [candidate division Zixibacteria bacterium]
MPNPEKAKQVAELTELFKAAPAVAVTDYAGLSVGKITQLRKELREASIKYLVAKNTLMQLAVTDAGMGALSDFFRGPTAVAFSADDPGRMAKILYDFAKVDRETEKPQIKALFIDGILYSGADVERISKLPGREQLLANLVGAVTAPLQNLVGTLDGVMRQFVMTIEAIKEKTGE